MSLQINSSNKKLPFILKPVPKHSKNKLKGFVTNLTKSVEDN